MGIDTDILIDRRRIKRRLMVWRILAVAAFAVAGISILGASVDVELNPGPYVAHVSVDGLILRDDDLNESILSVGEDPDAVALVVSIDSPGGTYVASEMLYHNLRKVAASGRPVTAVIGDSGASGGYMVALGADRIYAGRGSITGSIGVIMETANVLELLDKIGIRPEVIKSGALKAQPNPVEPFSQEARSNIQGVIDDLHNVFVHLVVARRGLSKDAADRVSDGRIFTGGQALAARLIDDIGGVDEALEWLGQAHDIDSALPMRDITPVEDIEFFNHMMGSLWGKMLFSERLELDGVLALWQL